MNPRLPSLLVLLATMAPGFASAATFTSGNLVVSRVGDGTNALVNTAGALNLLEFSPTGTSVQTITIPTTLQIQGTATTEGALALSTDGQSVSIGGYMTPFTGTGALSGRTNAEAARGYVNVSYTGAVASPVAINAFSNGSIRGVVSGTSGVWTTGANTGVIYNSSGSNTTVSTTNSVNNRVVNTFNGNLYFSTGSGTHGVYGLSGLPTNTGNTATLLLAVTNPYDFAFNAGGTVAYVAANTGANNGSITRFAFNGTSWTSTGSITTTASALINGITGLAVEFGATGDTLFGVTPTSLIKLTYTNSSSSFGTISSLASAGTNYAFRGLEFAPVPEASTSALLIGLGALSLCAVRRRRA